MFGCSRLIWATRSCQHRWVNVLDIKDIHAGYGQHGVLRGVSLQLAAGQTLALLGRNGSGRSTLAKALMGMLPARGSVMWRGQQLQGRKTYEIARLGLGYVPESRDVFANLSVAENLLLGHGTRRGRGRWNLDDIYGLFPQLRLRSGLHAGALSGGEQQMLAIGRALMGRPSLICMDEPTMGLSPLFVDRVLEQIQVINAQGVTSFMVEQNATLALQIAHRGYVLQNGRIALEGRAQELLDSPQIQDAYLGESEEIEPGEGIGHANGAGFARPAVATTV